MKLYFFGDENEVFNWVHYKYWDLFISFKDSGPKTNDEGYMIVWSPYFSIGEKTLDKYEAGIAREIENMPVRLSKLLIKNLFEYLDDD
jgi:hypothetical protein